jgi:stage II sporulation protein D
MKKDSGNRKWLLLMLGLVAVSVAFTAAVVLHMVSKEVSNYPWDDQSTESGQAEILLENIYITANDTDTVTFLYDGETYRIRGCLREAYRGVADVCIYDDAIQKIYTKQSQIDGTLLSYSADSVEVEGYGLLTRSDSMRVYRMTEEVPEQIALSDLAVGTEALTYIVGEGKICAILKNEQTAADTIRVLIKNGTGIVYESLFLTGSDEWTINGEIQAAGAPVEMTDVVCRMEQTAGNAKDLVDAEIGQVRTAQVECTDGFLYITDSDGNKKSEGYEGTFLVRDSDGGVVLVNQLSIEDYVRYVLPSEMADYFSMEAQKAQAVCARTFAYAQLNNTGYAAYGANVDDSTSYQVYNRVGTTELTDRAAQDTYGEILVSDNSPITCYYYSTSPGVTTDLEVWGQQSPDYIERVCTLLDLSDKNEYFSGALAKSAGFEAFLSDAPASYDSSSPYYRWTALICAADCTYADYGKILGLSVTKRSVSGYVTELTVSCENGTAVLTEELKIRTLLGGMLSYVELSDGTYRDSLTVLPSACFYVKQQDGDMYTLSGGGYGHGIGMSQYAAGAMAEAGMTYDEIVSFFYKNTEIVKQ